MLFCLSVTLAVLFKLKATVSLEGFGYDVTEVSQSVSWSCRCVVAVVRRKIKL